MRYNLRYYVTVALSFVGGAMLLYSCGQESVAEDDLEQNLVTEYGINMEVVMSENGDRSYVFVAPLLEGYSLAKEPYREFREGVEVTTFYKDSTKGVDMVMTSNYAIYYTGKELWEAKGDVVVTKADGKTLYTQQLFWNAKTKRIYTNVDYKLIQNKGRDVFVGVGFEANDDFSNWRLRSTKGRMEFEMAPQGADSLSTQDSLSTTKSAEPAQPPLPMVKRTPPPMPERKPSAPLAQPQQNKLQREVGEMVDIPQQR